MDMKSSPNLLRTSLHCNDLYSGKFDVNWDVRDKKRASRVFVQGSFRNNTVEDFAISAQTIYPGRELSASIQRFPTLTLIVPSGLFLFNNVDPVMVTGSC
jgi:hypothetical protein